MRKLQSINPWSVSTFDIKIYKVIPRIIYGPNGICEDRLLDFLINDGNAIPRAIIDERNNIIETEFDHRIAMAFAVMGTKIGPLNIKDSESINTSFPGFLNELNKIGGKILWKK